MEPNLVDLILKFKMDSESVYNTWFIYNNMRMKAFRSIRRGVIDTIRSIKDETFRNHIVLYYRAKTSI